MSIRTQHLKKATDWKLQFQRKTSLPPKYALICLVNFVFSGLLKCLFYSGFSRVFRFERFLSGRSEKALLDNLLVLGFGFALVSVFFCLFYFFSWVVFFVFGFCCKETKRAISCILQDLGCFSPNTPLSKCFSFSLFFFFIHFLFFWFISFHLRSSSLSIFQFHSSPSAFFLSSLFFFLYVSCLLCFLLSCFPLCLTPFFPNPFLKPPFAHLKVFLLSCLFSFFSCLCLLFLLFWKPPFAPKSRVATTCFFWQTLVFKRTKS